MTTDSIQDQIRVFLAKHVPEEGLAQDQDIFEDGFVNSLFAVQLVLFVEKEFQIKLGRDDLKRENFKNAPSLAQLVQSKL